MTVLLKEILTGVVRFLKPNKKTQSPKVIVVVTNSNNTEINVSLSK